MNSNLSPIKIQRTQDGIVIMFDRNNSFYEKMITISSTKKGLKIKKEF